MVDSTRAQKNYPGQKSLSSQPKGKEFEKLLHISLYDQVEYTFIFIFQFSIALQYFAGKRTRSILNIHFKYSGLDENTNPKRHEVVKIVKIHEETETSGKFLKLFQKYNWRLVCNFLPNFVAHFYKEGYSNHFPFVTE